MGKQLRRPRPALEALEGREVPATIVVSTVADVLNPADSRVSLREAITFANATPAHDTIVLPAGLYRIAIPPNAASPDPNATGSFDILKGVSLVGAGPGRTVLDAGRFDRVFGVTGTAAAPIGVLFHGLTVRGGRSVEDGGGVLMGHANLTLRDCVVRGNETGGNGAGISNGPAPGTGHLTLIRTAVCDNAALNSGGGVHLRGNVLGQGSTLRLVASQVLRNTARGGGGGFRADTAFLTSSVVSGNTALTLGGGIQTGTAVLTNCTVNGNRAAEGGGIHAESGLALSGSTLSRNTATGSGGGVYARGSMGLTNTTVSSNVAAQNGGGLYGSQLSLRNCTVARNAASEGGGIYHPGRDRAFVKNSILALNRATGRRDSGQDIVGPFGSGGGNLVGDATGSTGFGFGDQVGTNQTPLDPRIGPLANNGGPTQTHAPLPGSPAIDRGDNFGAPVNDQRGAARVRDGDGNGSPVIDIGAFER